MKHFIIVAALLFAANVAKADSVWSYQGNVFGTDPYTVSEGYALTGTVLLNNANQVTGWNFNGGYAGPRSGWDIFTNQNSFATVFDIFGSPTSTTPFQAGWDIQLYTLTGGSLGGGLAMATVNLGPNLQSDYSTNFDGSNGQTNVDHNPGVWTEVITTPEPGTMLLLGIGLLGVALWRRV